MRLAFLREHKGEIVFLRRVVPGGANKSYGIQVAKLAGIPHRASGVDAAMALCCTPVVAR